MEQQHPAEPVDALIEIALIFHAFHQCKVGKVPHSPQTGGRTKKMQAQEGSGREDAADCPNESSGHAAGFGEENCDDREDVHGEIQRPDCEWDMVAPVECLADVVAVVNQHGDDHDDPVDEHGMRGFFVQLLIEHGGGLFVGHGKSPSHLNYLSVIIDQLVIIKYHRGTPLSRERYKKRQDKYVLRRHRLVQIPFPGHRLVQHRQVYQPILMTLLQTQCHQGFPGSKGSENFLFFH